MNKFYITTAIPYVNANPHIGHALEFVQSDTIARYHRIIGDEVLLLCGSDDNALKNVQAAEKEKIPVQKFVDKNSKLFEDLAQKLNIQFDIFQKGSDAKHHFSSQKLWELCYKNGDIYKKEYKGLYCVGCELFYDKEELNEKGECFEHPGKKLDEISETNYFFKLFKYQNKIKDLIESDDLKITPEERKHEALSFIKQGLKDISISRSNKRAKNWGVDVPNDPTQKEYVWFDALNIYQSGIGFGTDERSDGVRLQGEAEDKRGTPTDKRVYTEKDYQHWWPADLHVIGKGILRFHAIYWPAFLLSAGLKLPKELFVHGYLTIDGQKMSKTIGNVIDPLEIIEKYGTDSLRYYLLREIPATSDGDFSEKRFKEVYNADLANGLGNLVARVAKLAEKSGIEFEQTQNLNDVFKEEWLKALSTYDLNISIQRIWLDISIADKHINHYTPWLEKDNNRLKNILQEEINSIRKIALRLKSFLPETAEKIQEQFKGPKITSQKPLFPRI